MVNNSNQQESISEEEKLNLAEKEKLATEEKERKKAALVKFLDLDIAGPNTIFLEIDYAGKQGRGRTVIALGEFAMHTRSTGYRTGKFHDKKMNIDLPGEQEFDITTMTLRHHISTVTLTRRQREQNEIETLQEGVPQGSMYCASLIIHFSEGSFEISNLDIPMALDFRRTFYTWIFGTY